MVTIVRRTPGGALTVSEPWVRPIDVLNEAETFLSEVWAPRWERTAGTGGIYVDMYEFKDGLVIRAELAGFKREDIDLTFEGDSLTIKAEKREGELGEVTYYSKERCYGTYSRTILLPFPVNSDKFVATYEHGLLEVRVPKGEEYRGKHIEIK